MKGKWIVAGSGLLIGAALLFGKYYYRTQFSMDTITMELPPISAVDIPALTSNEHQQVLEILSQPYTYLGMGNQSFAFESADHQYVLKFFKFAHLKPNEKDADTAIARSKQRRIDRIFNSHQLAYELNKDNAGLIYLQLRPDEHFQQVVDVTDRWGHKQQVDLSKVVFVLQRKTTPARTEISKLLDKGDVETAKKRFQAMIDLHLSEYSRGIYDQDHNVMHNTGFIGEKAIRFDVGKMARKEEMKTNYHHDLERVRNRIDKWLKKYYPQYHDEIVRDVLPDKKIEHSDEHSIPAQ